MLRLVFLGIFAACFVIASSSVCLKDECDHINCTAIVATDHQPPCQSNQVTSDRSYCGCCEVCLTLVGEGEHCGVHVDLTMVPIPYDCREGLTCVKDTPLTGVCVKEE
ncbi:hypothetical protein L9F63_027667 [Diploptera punctata]|uniref:Uncharacterized protein n=2 Tax=Diploptera punctata TaxID=6984 RepID=A0AAD8A606_DIPPU|nr:hypothetical protein L9F63_027667 [Diploptera punctata]